MLLIFWSCSIAATAYGAEPVTVVTGTWGKEPGQFFFTPFGQGGYLKTTDTGDDFPHDFGVDKQGKIYINDDMNRRIQVFSSSGKLLKTMNAPQETGGQLGWPDSIYVDPSGACMASFEASQKYFFNVSGELVKKVDVVGAASPATEGYFVEVTMTHFELYSTSGEMIKVYTRKPLELGMVKTSSLGKNDYLITVTYPDKAYDLSSDRKFVRYVRDAKGVLYGVNARSAWRFNPCGKRAAMVMIPPDQKTTITGTGGVTEVKVDVEYGEPVVSPKGDIYTWKRTPQNYFIVTWPWEDDPRASEEFCTDKKK